MRPVSLVSTIDYFDIHEPMVIRVSLFNTWKLPFSFPNDYSRARRVLFHSSFVTLHVKFQLNSVIYCTPVINIHV